MPVGVDPELKEKLRPLIAEKTSRRELERQSRERYRELYGDAPQPPEVANIQAAIELTDPDELRTLNFRGRLYDALPISFPDGLRLERLTVRVRKAQVSPDQEQALSEIEAVSQEIVTLFRRLVRPRSRLERLLWKLGLGRNPFATATEQEVGALLGFSRFCRTIASNRPPVRQDDPSARPPSI